MMNIYKTEIKTQTEYIKNLEETCKAQEAQIKLLENKLTWMMEQMTLAKHKKIGASSEKSEYDQLSIFNEAEKEADVDIKEPTIEEITYKRKKQVGKKNDMLKDLPEEVIELKIVPPAVIVVKHVAHVYSCRTCETKGDIYRSIYK